MEDKMKRESKKCMEVLFKKYDTMGSGSINMDSMRNIMRAIIDNFKDDEQLEMVMSEYTKVQKYTRLNPQTKKLEVKYQENSIDFPSAMAIAVHFLKKNERRESNAFAGKGLIRFSDLPTSEVLHIKRSADSKRRLY